MAAEGHKLAIFRGLLKFKSKALGISKETTPFPVDKYKVEPISLILFSEPFNKSAEEKIFSRELDLSLIHI